MFLDAYAGDPGAYADTIAWFKTLPLWLDLGYLRVIHACWDKQILRELAVPVLTDDLLHASCDKSRWDGERVLSPDKFVTVKRLEQETE